MMMDVSKHWHRFPIVSSIVALTVVTSMLAGAVWLGFPSLFGETPRLHLLVGGVFGVVWITGVAGLALVALLGPLGPMTTISAYFGGMALRLALTMGLAMLLFHKGLVEGRPLAVCLAIAYLPALAIEVAFVARYLWLKDSMPQASASGATEALA